MAAAGLDLLDLHDVAVGFQMHVVEQAYRRHDEAHFPGELAPERLDLFGQLVLSVLSVDERQKGVADLDLEFVHRQGGRDRLFGRLRVRGLGPGDHLVGGLPGLRAGGGEGEIARAACQREERDHWDARQQRHHAHHGRRHAERLGVPGKLAGERLVGRLVLAGLRDEQARRGRDDQRGDLRHEAVADGQERVGLRRLAEGQPVLRHADDHAGDDVDEGDHQAGNGVAAHEFRRAVHGAEEARLVFQRLASRLCGHLVDQTRRQVCVDGHLLAGHRIEAEPRRDLRDAARAFGDHDEIHDHEDREHDQPDHEIAAHHEAAEGLDDVAGGRRALVAILQDQPCRGEVERQPQHGRDQQHRGKGGELQRRLDEQRRHQDQHGECDRDGQRHVEHHGRQRHDEHDQDRHDAHGGRPAPPVALPVAGGFPAAAGITAVVSLMPAPAASWEKSARQDLPRGWLAGG